MDFSLTEEQQAVLELARQIFADYSAPEQLRGLERQDDPQGPFDASLWAALAEAGLLSIGIPEAYGGAGAGILGLTVAIEEVTKYSNVTGLMLLLTRLPTGPIMIAGTEEQKQKYLPGIAEGTQRCGFGLSEPQAGSDVAGMRTRATPDPDVKDGWILNGQKCWMSGVVQADWYTIFAKTGDPNEGGGQPEWPRYRIGAAGAPDPMALQFGDVTKATKEPMSDTFALWDDYFEAANKQDI